MHNEEQIWGSGFRISSLKSLTSTLALKMDPYMLTQTGNRTFVWNPDHGSLIQPYCRSWVVLMHFYKAHPLARPVPEASGVECEVCISLSGSGQKATEREREREREKEKKTSKGGQKAKGFALARGPPLLYTFYEKSEIRRSLCTIIRKQPYVEFCLSRSFDKLF